MKQITLSIRTLFPGLLLFSSAVAAGQTRAVTQESAITATDLSAAKPGRGPNQPVDHLDAGRKLDAK